MLDAVEMIRREKVRGASWALYTAVKALIESYEEGLLDCSESERISMLIESANKSMAPLANLAMEVRRACAKGPKAAVDAARSLLEMQSTAKERLREMGKLVEEGSTIVTLSYSSSVESLLSGARGRVEKIIVFESRPGGEGAIFAATLRSEGFEVALSPDTMMAYWIDRADLVVIGSDSVTMDGCILNKVGSLQLAIISRYYNTPLAVVFDALKIHPSANCSTIEIEERTYLAAGYGPVRYPLFDKVPLDLVSVLITDKGVLEPNVDNIRRLWREAFG